MRWHVELLIEAALFILLWCKPAPRWFAILIGVDFAANVLQILPYRFGLPQHSRIIWTAGVIATAPLTLMALVESSELPRSLTSHRHVRILAFWIAAQLCCITLQTQRAWVIPVNHVLLTMDAACFLGWIALFLLGLR